MKEPIDSLRAVDRPPKKPRPNPQVTAGMSEQCIRVRRRLTASKPTGVVLLGGLVFDSTEETRQVRYWARRFARNEKRRESEGERAKDAIRALARENWLPELRRCLAQLATRGPGQRVTKKAFFFLEQIELEIRRVELGDAGPDFDGGADG